MADKDPRPNDTADYIGTLRMFRKFLSAPDAYHTMALTQLNATGQEIMDMKVGDLLDILASTAETFNASVEHPE